MGAIMAEYLIKKYPNRRLYDTRRSRYIVLADIRSMIRDGHEVRIVDSQSGDNITRNILLQIVADRESGSARLLTSDVLLDLIRCSDNLSGETLSARLEPVLRPFVDTEQPRETGLGLGVASSTQSI